MGYLKGYTIGIIISLVIVLIIIIAIVAYKKNLSANTERIWKERVDTVAKNRQTFYEELNATTFNTDVDFSFSNYYRTVEPIEIMAFKADLNKKQLAIGSFDDEGCSKIFDFKEIKGFAIIDGEKNTTLESFSTGSAVGKYGFASGVSHTSTYQETTVGNVKLKIEVDDIKKPVYIFIINKYQVDVQSKKYSELINTIESIKTFLTNLIEENKN